MFKKRAILAVIWSAVEQVGAKGLSTIFMLVFARFLTPEDFGVFAAVTLLMLFSSRLAVMGLDSVVVQREALNENALSTAYWMALSTSVALAIVMVIFADEVASLFGSPQVAELIPYLSVGMVITTATSLITALLRRDLNMKALARRTLTANFLSGLIATPLILSGHGAWGLVVQSVAGSALTFVLTIWLIGWPIKFVYDRLIALEMLRFGAPILGADLLTKYNQESPKLFVGFFLGIEALGIFSMAMRVLNLLQQVVGVTLSRVTLPIMSQVSRSSPERVGEVYLRIVRLAGAVIFPAFIMVASLREPLIALLLGPTWSEISPIVGLLCGAGILTTLNYINGATLVASGYPQARFWFSLLRALVGSVLLIVATSYGLVAVGIAFLIRGMVVEPLQLLFLLKIVKKTLLPYLSHLKAAALAAILMWLSSLVIQEFTVHLSYFAVVFVAGSLSFLLYGSVLILVDKSLRLELKNLRNRERSGP